MQAFEFYSPTCVHFGKGAESKVGADLKKRGAKKVLLHYGGGSVIRSGLLGRVKDSLSEAEIAFTELGGVQPNPVLSLVRTGAALCCEEQVDFILAVGGGSVIDSSKAIALAAPAPEVDPWDFFEQKAVPQKHLPVGSVLTIAAAGSEMSTSMVITNEDGMLKRGLNTELNRPVVAFMNPELLYTLPAFQIACGATDIVMHTLERYFSPITGNELTDQIAEGLLRTAIHFGPLQLENPQDYQAASEMMWAGSISHNHLTGLGNAGDWATHQLGHELSSMFGKAHGATLAAMWGAWAHHVYKDNPSRFARYARNVWGVTEMDDNTAALEGIARTVQFFASLGMPTCIGELVGRTLTSEELDELSVKCTFFGKRTIGSFRKLDYNGILAVYQAANH
ncbi:iron-containing alcohol dehydrogenase [Anaerotruncus sp. AF02-27]|uniref:iron-containing alcohol dehydrogenase n=1 Tax=Anaerotruncus TaxID=244127 RepID=UPI000E4CDAA0|nr:MULTISPECIES: iron-containing alcohol dehydrogenase [Anaerotruncus]RGX56101.1 iron-containing alcohol dehydrogenase [Anaerotruncus sp. AF02-27]